MKRYIHFDNLIWLNITKTEFQLRAHKRDHLAKVAAHDERLGTQEAQRKMLEVRVDNLTSRLTEEVHDLGEILYLSCKIYVLGKYYV